MFGPSHDKPGLLVRRYAPVAATWAVAWVLIGLIDRRIDLGTQAMVIVLASAVAAFWASRWLAILAPALAVQAFTYWYVPPRQDWMINLEEHGLMLVTSLVVSWIVSLLMQRQRELADNEHRLVLRSEQLRRLGDALREVDDPGAQASLLQDALTTSIGGSPVMLILRGPPGDTLVAPEATECTVGDPGDDEAARLRAVMASGVAWTGTGDTARWCLPMRGRSASYGAALLPLPGAVGDPQAMLRHAQALCDLMGAALERANAVHAAHAAREAAQIQSLRNTLLAAISHDHRTPLATILGAASSLQDQDLRLSADQRQRLVATIVGEATQLARLTHNTLQLARLDTPGLVLQMDWESLEEIVGTVVQRARARAGGDRLRVYVKPGLPLVRCDAVLLSQLLDNLIDNALTYADRGAVEVWAGLDRDRMALAVDDRGPGIAEAHKEMIFEAFKRGAPAPHADHADAAATRGAGVGLAVCRAIARVHQADVEWRPRAGGGSRFILLFPASATADAPQANSLPLPLS